jgi:hypothetical protein
VLEPLVALLALEFAPPAALEAELEALEALLLIELDREDSLEETELETEEAPVPVAEENSLVGFKDGLVVELMSEYVDEMVFWR